jgi:hypothetical protein
MTFINCTPHPITLVRENGEVIMTLPKGEVIPRLSQSTKQVDVVNGVSITETQFGETQDLPAPVEGTLLIVSRLVLSANPDRNDLVVPNELVRDADGNIIGCKSLARN